MSYNPPKNYLNALERELLENENCQVMTQCTAENGIVGDWLRHDSLHARISPIFNDLRDLYLWMHDNGFEPTVPGSLLSKYRKIYK